MKRPAALGGPPAFPGGLPFARPARPPLERVMARLAPSYESGMLTNGDLVRQLEREAAARLGVDRVVAVSSCTTGLMLLLQALAVDGSVAMPSFTFSATAHAVAWNGLTPVFADCDATSFQVDPSDLRQRLDGAGAILATHVFGAPSPVEELEAVARDAAVPLAFDAAHAFGAQRGDRPVGGFGVAEVFSLTPTKPLVAGEGGLVATDDADLAARLGMARDYGNPGDYDTRFPGLNGRLSELHAAVALESLVDFEENLATRQALARRYHAGLAELPGVAVQGVDASDTSTYKDFTVAVDDHAYGLSRDELVEALRAEGVDTRCYFSPPVHLQQSYAHLHAAELPVTEAVSRRVVSLPIYPDLSAETIDTVAEVLVALHAHAEEVRGSSSG